MCRILPSQCIESFSSVQSNGQSQFPKCETVLSGKILHREGFQTPDGRTQQRRQQVGLPDRSAEYQLRCFVGGAQKLADPEWVFRGAQVFPWQISAMSAISSGRFGAIDFLKKSEVAK